MIAQTGIRTRERRSTNWATQALGHFAKITQAGRETFRQWK